MIVFFSTHLILFFKLRFQNFCKFLNIIPGVVNLPESAVISAYRFSIPAKRHPGDRFSKLRGCAASLNGEKTFPAHNHQPGFLQIFGKKKLTFNPIDFLIIRLFIFLLIF